MIFDYTPNLSGLVIIKTQELQRQMFFFDGHPEFLIPDFNVVDAKYGGIDKCDIWLSFQDYLEKKKGEDVWDQDGGEVIDDKVIDANTGLTKCKYIAYGISFQSDEDNYKDYEVEIEGYVVSDGSETYFAATKVTDNN